MLTQLSIDHPMIEATALTGVMDDTTVLSLTEFQKLAGLAPTGELDKITWKHLVLQFTLSAHHQIAKKREILK